MEWFQSPESCVLWVTESIIIYNYFYLYSHIYHFQCQKHCSFLWVNPDVHLLSFSSFWKTSFNIIVLQMYWWWILSAFVYFKVFILPSFLKCIFPGHIVLYWFFFLFQFLSHCHTVSCLHYFQREVWCHSYFRSAVQNSSLSPLLNATKLFSLSQH